MAIVIGALVTLALLAGIAWLVLRLPRQLARRLWLVTFTVVLGSAVAYMAAHSFLAKWAFKGDHPRDGLMAMVEGTAARPFVYRRLAPDLVGAAAEVALAHLPERALDYFEQGSRLHRYKGDWTGEESWDRRKAVAFHLAYLLVAASFFGTLLAGAGLLQAIRGGSWLEAVCTAGIATCLAPMMFVGGGYLYDAPELMLWTALLWAALCGRWWISPLLFGLMIVNKESAILVLPALASICFLQRGWLPTTKWLGLLGAIGVAWSVYIRLKYAQNPGGTMEFWLPGNLEFWGNPKSYFMLAPLYSPALPSPRGANVVLLLLALLPLRFGFPALSRELRWATGITAAILVPLLIVACYRDEMRNLSLLFPLLLICVVQGAHRLVEREVSERGSA